VIALYAVIIFLLLAVLALNWQVGILWRKVRALENPPPDTFDTCTHGYVRPCPICDAGKMVMGEFQWGHPVIPPRMVSNG
jgi:hypothetical protein